MDGEGLAVRHLGRIDPRRYGIVDRWINWSRRTQRVIASATGFSCSLACTITRLTIVILVPSLPLALAVARPCKEQVLKVRPCCRVTGQGLGVG